MVCGFALHIASLLAREDSGQSVLGDHDDIDRSGSGGRSGDFRGVTEARPAAVVPEETATAAGPERPPAPLSAPESALAVPLPVFLSLERYARMVDVTYCVGMTGSGISQPFSCASRCADFPELRLVATWNTGVLMRDSCGYIAVDDSAREIIVAFRGTYSIANTVADLSTIPQKYVPYEPGEGEDEDADVARRAKCTNCTVHMGFLASWESARSLIQPIVAEARHQSMNSSPLLAAPAAPYRVHLIGHSLGGAVAALAALEMKAVLGWEDVQVTTFGEPRVGNLGFAKFLEGVFNLRSNTATKEPKEPTVADAYRRVTHKNDPVPLLPLSDWGYRSHAGEIFITKVSLSPTPEDVIQCRGRSDPACSDVDGEHDGSGEETSASTRKGIIPPNLKLWELFFAHRDYFWRLGLCLPGGDPADWGGERYNYTNDEL
ncbi:extracellular triacylglycerol lipase [Sporothrix brasiliensis 5110]|uniref:Extracellular triacylglycerol lipase n=1 Tax=Sporothrix brasiliensis 5110 TaxID=1398154 RepID=A0A0C2FBL4_9PEZI|nr:extracellular triacylglycerol lipase [Sporothrix brasiliensis 5110]KIH88478.1 extracellular triacylglycerol lipase [Sporothrix brasiliensis 5110]